MATLEQVKALGGSLTPLPKITAETLNSGIKPATVTPTATDTTPYSTIANGAVSSVMGDFTNLQNQQQAQEKTQTTSGQNQLDLMGLLSGRTADTQVSQEQAGVNEATTQQNEYLQQLANLNSQASSLQREAQAIPIQDQQNATGQGVTDRGLAPITSARLRENALKALSIAQQSDIASAALTGSTIRLNQAKEKAQQIVDLKYKPIEDALAREKELYTLNKDLLDRTDKKRSEALVLAIKKDEEATAERKASEKTIEKLMIDASSVAPADVLARAKDIQAKGGSATQVAMALGQYGGDYLKNEAYKSQLLTDKAQRVNIYDQIAIRNKELLLKKQETNDKKALLNFQAPPIVNAQTGKVDPKSAVASIIKSTGGKLTGGKSALEVISSVQSFAERNSQGTFAGVGLGSGAKLERFMSQNEISNRQDINAIGLKVQQWASGASLTEEQTKMVEKFTPQLGDSDNAVKTKVNGLVNFMMGQVSADLVGQGINYSPEPIDMFSGIQSVDNNTFLGSIPSAPKDTTKLFDNKTFFDR